ncbi:MAG: glycosyltransferase [Dehalococcoidales bacterium]|nr:glycosyltransferase [Dehalococcoidales bacterium]
MNKKLDDQYKDLLKIAVLIPCFNEENTVAQVVHGFRSSLPMASIYVYDNNSRDNTVEIARQAGAVVRAEPKQGKGQVVRRMFADIEADIYILVDGDGTYDATQASELARTLIYERCDMVAAVRDLENCPNYRRSHFVGTKTLSFIVNRIFKGECADIFSGYRVFSRRFVKSFPMISTGFEIETELTIHALELHVKTQEMKSPYKERELGSESKLRTVRDGLRILRTILLFTKEERPLQLFGGIFAVLTVISIGLAWPIFTTYFETGLVPRFPTAILSSALMLLAFLSLTAGFILTSITTARREIKRLFYLSIPGLELLPRHKSAHKKETEAKV